uniref:Uncharacterized protein n=1 Tax=Zea mays TaxID=4577 RepID=C4J8N2_MAIZE|nr:unknown [Zea mays]
MDARPPIRPL